MKSRKDAGYSLIIAIIAVNIFAIFLMMARSMWETELMRDLEKELLFRAGQYVKAIELYKKKHINLYPKTLEVLFEEKFLRKQYKDPMTESGKWNIVMKESTASQGGYLVVPEDLLPQYESRAYIVGVCSTSPEEGYRQYRKKKRYSEWAVYLGGDPDKDMPDMKYVGEEGESDQRDNRGGDDRREIGTDPRDDSSGRKESVDGRGIELPRP